MSEISRSNNKEYFEINYSNTVNLVFNEGDDNGQNNNDTILNEVYILVTISNEEDTIPIPNERNSPITILNERRTW